MAFVPTPFTPLRSRSFAGAALSRTPPTHVATVRMSDEAQDSSPTFGKAGKSMWKENFFTGGFPGGEAFYRAWAEDGMTKDVPDVPTSMQPKSAPNPTEAPRKNLMTLLDSTEFFTGFSRDEETDETTAEGVVETSALEEFSTAFSDDPDAPDPALYEKYYPAATRFLAPDIKIIYEKDFVKDRVGMAMTEVTASSSDLYFPKRMKNKAPMIEISYNGSLQTGSVVFYMSDIEPLPTLVAPPKRGDAVTELVPGNSGGLKLQYSIAGEGAVNI